MLRSKSNLALSVLTLYDVLVLLTTDCVSGWFWAGSDVRLGSRDGAVTGDWSKTGGAGEPQPDNREFKVRMSASDMIVSPFICTFKVEGKHDEACIAMLNNFYGDGAVSLYSLEICRRTVIPPGVA